MDILRVHGRLGFALMDLRDYLGRFEYAYNSLYTFEALIEASAESIRRFPHFPGGSWPLLGFVPVIGGRPRFLISWPPTPESVVPIVPSRHRLVVSAARFESPGWWNFLGQLNPLEVLRQYLNDRHEHRKDRNYREAAEARKLQLENDLLENKVLRERIDIAKSLGATDQDLVPLLNELVYRPLRQLNTPQDRGVIERAELLDGRPKYKR